MQLPAQTFICENPECGKPFIYMGRARTSARQGEYDERNRARRAAGQKEQRPHWCSKKCRNRSYHLAHPRGHTPRQKLTEAEREAKAAAARERRNAARRAYRTQESRREYEAAYNRRPERMEYMRERNRARYVPHPRVYPPKPPKLPASTPLPAPYTGHRWLDMAREVVGDPYVGIRGSEWADRRDDELGEVTLAILEGRDPEAALKEFRRREFTPRHLTKSISEWAGSDDEAWRVDTIDQLAVESAEEVVVAKETVLHKVRYHGGTGKGLMGTSKQQSRSSRVSNNP